MQKVNERLKTILTPVDIRKSCSKIENAVWEGFREVYNSDIRSQIASTNTNDLINNYSTNFIFVQAKPKPEILTVFGHGGSQWSTDTPVAIGSGEIFALAVFGKYNQIPLNIEQAKLLAYKTVNEAISNATFGLCHPIDVWVTNNDGTHQLQGEELTALQDADRVLRAGELSLMTTYAPVS
jgi:20S proteasome alpha/beta subunit